MKEKITDIVAAVASIGGMILVFMSFSTGYYTFGEMNSIKVLILMIAGILIEIFAIIASIRWSERFWTQLLPFAGIICLTTAACMLLGDRVEGIGNCIVTDYDAGHGGEEAIYYSLAGAGLMLLGVVSNIKGCFMENRKTQKNKGEQNK